LRSYLKRSFYKYIKRWKRNIEYRGFKIIRESNDRFCFEVLGMEDEKISDSSNDKLEGTVNMLIEMRKQARDNKNFALSDQIRDQLIALGIQPDGRRTTFSI
jgi:cysteinyl-tRNA synthetase